MRFYRFYRQSFGEHEKRPMGLLVLQVLKNCGLHFEPSFPLFHKYQINGADDEEKGQDVVPVDVLVLKQDVGNNGKDG